MFLPFILLGSVPGSWACSRPRGLLGKRMPFLSFARFPSQIGFVNFLQEAALFSFSVAGNWTELPGSALLRDRFPVLPQNLADSASFSRSLVSTDLFSRQYCTGDHFPRTFWACVERTFESHSIRSRLSNFRQDFGSNPIQVAPPACF